MWDRWVDETVVCVLEEALIMRFALLPSPHATHTHTLDGTPGVVDLLSAVAETKTSISVAWFPPLTTNVNDPLLLRYFVLSHPGDMFRFDLAEYSTLVAPTTDTSGMVSTILTGLSAGTRYVLALKAQSPTANSSNPEHSATVSTYGNGRLGLIRGNYI